MPTEPEPSAWVIPPPPPDADDLVAVGADLEPGTVLQAYRRGLFPMPAGSVHDRGAPVSWWSPRDRGVLPLDRLRVSRSLRQSVRRLHTTTNHAFEHVITRCAEMTRHGAWISREIVNAYIRLHRLGWAHSVEAWDDDGALVGGLYGIAVGGVFAGESMYHEPGPAGRDASKVALVELIRLLHADSDTRRLLDVQWQTPHLASLGVIEIPRADYLRRLERALTAPLPPAFA